MTRKKELIEEIEKMPDELIDSLLSYLIVIKKREGLTKNQPIPSEEQKFTFDQQAKPIWDIVVEIGEQIPEEDWEKVPTDLSKNFDDYQTQSFEDNQ